MIAYRSDSEIRLTLGLPPKCAVQVIDQLRDLRLPGRTRSADKGRAVRIGPFTPGEIGRVVTAIERLADEIDGFTLEFRGLEAADLRRVADIVAPFVLRRHPHAQLERHRRGTRLHLTGRGPARADLAFLGVLTRLLSDGLAGGNLADAPRFPELVMADPDGVTIQGPGRRALDDRDMVVAELAGGRAQVSMFEVDLLALELGSVVIADWLGPDGLADLERELLGPFGTQEKPSGPKPEPSLPTAPEEVPTDIPEEWVDPTDQPLPEGAVAEGAEGAEAMEAMPGEFEGPCDAVVEFVERDHADRPVECVPYLTPTPVIRWQTPTPRNGRVITANLQRTGGDGTPAGVEVRFPLSGTVQDLTEELVRVTATVTESTAVAGTRSSTAGPIDADQKGYPGFRFNAVPLKGHGVHRVEVLVVNAAGVGTRRDIEVEVIRNPAREREIDTKTTALSRLHDAFMRSLEGDRFKRDTDGALLEQAYQAHEQAVAAREAELADLDEKAWDEAVIRVWEGSLQAGSALATDGCEWQAHVVDDETRAARVRADIRGTYSSERADLAAYAAGRYLSDTPEYHFLIPRYQGAQGEYVNPDLRGPEAIQHAPDRPVRILYRDGCEAEAAPITVTASADPWGYCGPDQRHPGEIAVSAEGKPETCRIRGQDKRGKYLWSLVEKPAGAPDPQFENPVAKDTKVKVYAPGIYRARVQYGIGTICPHVQSIVTFEVYAAHVDLDADKIEMRDEGVPDERFVISADHGDTDVGIDVYARDGRDDYQRIPGSAAIELSSPGAGTLRINPPVTDAKGEVTASLRLPTRVPALMHLKVDVTELPGPAGARVDARPMSIRDEQRFALVPGELEPPLVLEAQVGSGGWREVGRAGAAADRMVPPPTPLPLRGLPRAPGQKIGLRFLGKDQHGNLLEDGTPVEWRLDGTGKLVYGPEAMETRQGMSAAKLESGSLGAPGLAGASGADQLIRISVGKRIFWLGNPLLGARVQMRLVGLGQGLIRRDPQRRTQAEATVTVNNEPLAGATVYFGISKGSLAGDDPTHYSATTTATTDGRGLAVARISDRYHSADGQPNPIRGQAWGTVEITGAVGQGRATVPQATSASGVVHGTFNDADLANGTRNIWPTGHVLDQSTLRTAALPFGAQAGGQRPQFQLQGTAGEEFRAEIAQDRRFAQVAHFPFTSPDANDNLPATTNASLYPLPLLADMKTRYYRAGWDTFPMTRNAAIELEPSTVMNGLAVAGQRHNIRVKGLTNAAIRFQYWPSAQSGNQYIFEGWGAGRDVNRGYWDIEQQRTPSGLFVRGRFYGHACRSRPAARAVTQWLPIRSGAWHVIEFTLSGSPFDDTVRIRLTVDGASANANTGPRSFNWLDGDEQIIEFGLPDGGKCWIYDLEIWGEINTAMNFQRPDGILVPALVGTVPAAGRVDLTVSDRQVREREGGGVLPRPQFPTNPVGAQHVVPFARVGSTYCSTWDFDTEIIPAMSPAAIRVYREAGEAAYGFVFGTGQGASGFVGDLLAGMIFIGDLRDVIKNLAYLTPGGEDPDWLEFGIALCGLALDVGELFSAGADTPVNFFAAAIKSLYKKMKALRNAQNAHVIKRVSAMLAEIMLSLLRDWRKGLITTQLSLVGWTLWDALKPMWDYFSRDIRLPTAALDFEAWFDASVELLDRVDLLLEIVLNSSVKAIADLTELCEQLSAFMRKNRMSARQMRQFLADQKQAGVTTDALRGALSALSRRSNLAHLQDLSQVPPSVLRGLIHVAMAHGAEAAYRVMRIHNDQRKLFGLLSSIDSAEKVIRSVHPRGGNTIFNKLIGRLLIPNKGNLNGVIQELALFHRYRGRIRKFQVVFRDGQEGADFLIEVTPGKFEWLESKALYSFTEDGIASRVTKLKRQFRRFKTKAPRRVGSLSVGFAVRYVFRGYADRFGGPSFKKAIQDAVRDCIKIGALPATFKPTIRFLGLARAVG